MEKLLALKCNDADFLHASSETWSIIFERNFTIMDPDGWDRSGDFQKSWDELISLSEFAKRVYTSTCEFKTNIERSFDLSCGQS